MIFICFRITASNYYGARHGIETLFQMILWDDKTREYKMLNNVNITDGPVFSHRGISLDTVRNYISVRKIQQVRSIFYDFFSRFSFHFR